MLHIRIEDVVPSFEILQKINEIDAFKYVWLNKISQSEFLNTVRGASIYDFIKPEYRVITPETDNKMMEHIFSHVHSRPRNYIEIENYAHLLQYIFANYKQLSLSEDLIHQMHRMLFEDVLPQEKNDGKYKNKPNFVWVIGVLKKKRSKLFEPAAPQDTPQLMQELIAWTNENLHKGLCHPIIIVALFADYFLAIHPFMEGNGRMARALIVLLLMQAGYLYMPYSSLDAIMKASKNAHYRSIWQTNQTIWSDKPNYEPWLAFFVQLLEKQKLLLEVKMPSLLYNL